jgi:hypothetical protein
VDVKQDKVPKYNDDGTYMMVGEDLQWSYKGSSLHHNKYIVEHNPDGSGALFTGSFNFSKNAEDNWENILITRIPSVIHAYRDNFINTMWGDTGHFDVIPPEAPVSYKYRGVISDVDCGDPDLWD